MSVYDRWHRTRPAADDMPCREHSKGATKLYPTAAHGKGDRWQVRWRDDTGRQRKENFVRRSDADTRDTALKASLQTGNYIDPSAARVKVRDFAAQYRADLMHRESTAERLDRVFRLHVDPLPLGNLAMGQVRPSHMRAWVKNPYCGARTIHTRSHLVEPDFDVHRCGQ